MARILGAGGLGEVILAITVVKVSVQIAKFGMEEAMMRFVPSYVVEEDDARLKGALSFALRFCLILSIILAVVVWSYSKLLSIPALLLGR